MNDPEGATKRPRTTPPVVQISEDQEAEEQVDITPAPASKTREKSRRSPSPDRSSRRSRSRSPEEEEEGTMTFRQKIALLRELFKDRPEIVLYPPTPGSPPTSLSKVNAPPKESKSVALPLNPTAEKISRDASNKLAGKDPRAKTSDAGGLPIKSYLKRPDYKDKSYRVSGKPKVTQAVALPFQFRTLQPPAKSKSTPALTLSNQEAVDMEVQLRRTGVVLSHQDWFLGAVRLLAETVQQNMETVPEEFTQLIELLESGTRASTDAQRLVTHMTHNWVLRRRDNYLRDTWYDLPESLKRVLRQGTFDQTQLFSVEDIDAVLKAYTEGATTRAVHKAGQPSTSQGGARRPQQPQQQFTKPSVMDRSYSAPAARQSWPSQPPARGRGGQRGRGRGKPHSSTPSKQKGEGGRK